VGTYELDLINGDASGQISHSEGFELAQDKRSNSNCHDAMLVASFNFTDCFYTQCPTAPLHL